MANFIYGVIVRRRIDHFFPRQAITIKVEGPLLGAHKLVVKSPAATVSPTFRRIRAAKLNLDLEVFVSAKMLKCRIFNGCTTRLGRDRHTSSLIALCDAA